MKFERYSKLGVGGGHPDPEIRVGGGGGLKKFFFGPSDISLVLK